METSNWSYSSSMVNLGSNNQGKWQKRRFNNQRRLSYNDKKIKFKNYNNKNYQNDININNNYDENINQKRCVCLPKNYTIKEFPEVWSELRYSKNDQPKITKFSIQKINFSDQKINYATVK